MYDTDRNESYSPEIRSEIDDILGRLDEGVAKKYQNPDGGLNAKGRAHFKRTEGANLKPPVSKEKAKKSKSDSKRRDSFCSRMTGQKKMHNIDCSEEPDKDICKSLRKWDCNEDFERKLDAAFGISEGGGKGLFHNINKRKKNKTSRSKKNSTIDQDTYNDMENWD